jgi:hypothetical protein
MSKILGGLGFQIPGYQLHVVIASMPLVFTEDLWVEYLGIAGGGSGGLNSAGGGGAGELASNVGSPMLITAGTYLIVIGRGGAELTSFGSGNNGGDTSFFGINLKGGGAGGGSAQSGLDGKDGASGGGGSTGDGSGGSGLAGFPGGGGSGTIGNTRSGGGGGGSVEASTQTRESLHCTG